MSEAVGFLVGGGLFTLGVFMTGFGIGRITKQ